METVIVIDEKKLFVCDRQNALDGEPYIWLGYDYHTSVTQTQWAIWVGLASGYYTKWR